MKVILISGKARSGKDTTALIMQEQLKRDNKRVLITHYADLLKYICKNFFGWNGEKDEEGRKILQYIGTDVIREKNPELWVNFVAQMLEYFHDNWDYVIIPDCRFPNEVSTMSARGFDTVYVRVERKNYISTLTQEQQNHPSETSLDGYEPDYCIENAGTIKDLENTVIKWIKESLYEHKA